MMIGTCAAEKGEGAHRHLLTNDFLTAFSFTKLVVSTACR